MALEGVIVVGEDAPRTVRVTVNSINSALDLSVVTDVELRMYKADDPSVTQIWSTAIETKTADQLVAVHTLDAANTAQPGTWRGRAWLTLPSGVVPTNEPNGQFLLRIER